MSRADILARARPLLIRLAKDAGLVAVELSDVRTIDTLRDLLIEMRPLAFVAVGGGGGGSGGTQGGVLDVGGGGGGEREQVNPKYTGKRESVFQPRVCGTEQSGRIADARFAFEQCETTLSRVLTPGRYKALTMTALEEAAMWATKAISHENG